MKKTALFLALCLLALFAGCTNAKDPEGRYVYATELKYSGEDDPKAYLEIAARSQKLLSLLEENVDAFVMNAYNFQDADGEGTPVYELNHVDLPVEIDPAGYCVSVDKNYLDIHGIKAADGSTAGEKLVTDDRTQNILVPEKFKGREQDILKAYHEQFYFEKVTAENSYNEDAGLSERLELAEADLTINVIYVEDGQKYPVYREDIICENGAITDPVVQVYTGNIHCNYAHSNLSQWTYFYSGETDPERAYEELRPYVARCGAEESLQSVKRVQQK